MAGSEFNTISGLARVLENPRWPVARACAAVTNCLEMSRCCRASVSVNAADQLQITRHGTPSAIAATCTYRLLKTQGQLPAVFRADVPAAAAPGVRLRRRLLAHRSGTGWQGGRRQRAPEPAVAHGCGHRLPPATLMQPSRCAAFPFNSRRDGKHARRPHCGANPSVDKQLLLWFAGKLFAAMHAVDADALVRYHFPTERLPTHTQVLTNKLPIRITKT
jgi:hypothetical protein